jgi:SAM-dependent methyltransferase
VLAELREGWDTAAREDAMFHILTDPDRSDGRWTVEEFFAHGQAEIDEAMSCIFPVLEASRRALDFGCGVGRLSQALAHHFDRVDGCDASPEMIDRAKALNREARIRYTLNTERLPFRAGTFDLVYSMIVLQHMPPGLAKGYVEEFARVLKRGGVMFFQLPEGTDVQHSAHPWLSMWSTERDIVRGWIERAGAEVLSIDRSHASGAEHQGWEYLARKGKR